MRLRTLLILATITYAAGCASAKYRDQGRHEAETDIARSHLELRAYGERSWSFDREYAWLLQDRLGVTFNQVAGCVVTEELLGTTNAYNDVMTKEIERRAGSGVLDDLIAEARKREVAAATRPVP